jgi:ABC-type glycerol-3-phosphate transport system permease component
MATVEIRDVRKAFGSTQILHGVSVDIEDGQFVVPVAILTELVTGDVYQWGALMAGSLLGSLPVAIFYSFFVDYYVSSLTGAVKE